MVKALTIAGSDPSGGAGIQADLKVFQAFGVYGLSAVAALTAQSSRGVKGVAGVNPQFLKEQLSVLLSDLEPDATKTGMLYSGANVSAVAAIIRKYAVRNVVVDPIIISTSGRRLAKRETPAAVKKKLLPLCDVVTPNVHEASVLSGIDIKTRADRERAAVRLHKLGAKNVIITGGHLGVHATDLVFDGEFHYLKARKRAGEYHGTGCTFSAALTAMLAKGDSTFEAAIKAKEFMNKVLKRSFDTGGGIKLLNI